MRRGKLRIASRLIVLVGPLTLFMILAVLMGVLGNLASTFITIYGVMSLGFGLEMGLAAFFISMAVFAVIRGILRYLEQASNHYIAFRLLAQIRDRVFTALRRLSPSKLDGRNKGDLISLITSDIEMLEVFYAHTVSPVMIALLYSIVMTIFISSFSAVLGIYALCSYIIVGIVLPLIFSHVKDNYAGDFRAKSGRLSGFVLDSLRGLEELIQFGCGKRRSEELDERIRDIQDDERRIKKHAGINGAVTMLVVTLLDMVLFLVGGRMYISGDITFDAYLVCFIALLSSFGPVIALSGLSSTLQLTFAAADRVLDILDEEPLVEDVEGKSPCSFDGAHANDVTFAYENEKILDSFSMDVEKNTIVGIEGKSGSGKSTLLKLFMRFYQTDEGRIMIGDRSVEDINTGDLRSMECSMSQTTDLFNDTIAFNIRLGKPDATDDEVIEASKKASLHDFVMTLPDGYQTKVGELGDRLSGGEKQRIGLARAFLRDSDFLLLDEPTSNLDSLNEAVILRALDRERGRRSVLLVSHRPSTLCICDRKIKMKSGRAC